MTPPSQSPTTPDPLASLGYTPVRLGWARLEILLGLSAVSIGLLADTTLPLIRGALIVLGGYLTLAGHRSHLYRSLNQQSALLLNHSNRGETRDTPSEGAL